MFAIIDIETTGSQPSANGITEVAVIIHDGEREIERFATLINPERPIPEFITRMTGITNRMVAGAPKFYEVAKKIVELTEGKIFVAHNVSFDYNFIRAAFRDLGFEYNRKTLCTVKLSRKFLPGFKSYSLGNLSRSLGIVIKERHRAMGDTEATAEIFRRIHEVTGKQMLMDLTAPEIKALALPPHLSREKLDQLPEEPGVYYFHDADGSVVYVGKSINIRKRVLQHIKQELKGKHALDFKARMHDITYQTTGTELIALLLESAEIKRIQPTLNQRSRRAFFRYGIFDSTDPDGYIKFKANVIRNNETPLISFPTLNDAKGYLERAVIKYELCQKLCGLQDIKGACFNFQIKQCHGACVHQESAADYNLRAKAAMESFGLGAESFLIIGAGRKMNEKSAVMVQQGNYIGFGYYDDTTDVSNPEHFIIPQKDNREVRQIIRSHMMHTPKDRIKHFDTAILD